MKIKRFVETDMRAAIRRVREEQGPDAVILSSRRVDDHVEVVAAVDYDESLVHQALQQNRPASDGAPTAASRSAAPRREAPPDETGNRADKAPAPTDENPSAQRIVWAQDPHLAEVRRDLDNVRSLLERQVGSLISRDWCQRQPYRAEAVRELAGIGVDSTLAREIAEALPEPGDGRRPVKALSLLRQRIPVPRRDPLQDGGVIALVGPTGVGKTTTIAKLAARYTQRHGLRDVALVTTDSMRVGGRQQLFSYGQMLGIPVFAADDKADLAAVMSRLAERTLVLLDTAGMSPRDTRLAAQLGMLEGARDRLRTYLVMAANAHGRDLQQVIERFRATSLSGCVLTKMDEATRIGGALSAIVRSQLPVAYVTDGQQVPQDLHRERPDHLILRALRAARECPEPQSFVTEEIVHACA